MKYYPETGSEGLFSGYINTKIGNKILIKLKKIRYYVLFQEFVCTVCGIRENMTMTTFVSDARSLYEIVLKVAAARLHLYSFMKRLEKNCVYVEYDSMMIKVKENYTDIPETSVFLGDITDELDVYGKVSCISEFVSGGPKNY
ncbi:hypothetical protein B566_EDAN001065 [Ephemera danica]|nr:hypothetical protein B566_EDAN001065 [Ephemera danica]